MTIIPLSSWGHTPQEKRGYINSWVEYLSRAKSITVMLLHDNECSDQVLISIDQCLLLQHDPQILHVDLPQMVRALIIGQ